MARFFLTRAYTTDTTSGTSKQDAAATPFVVWRIYRDLFLLLSRAIGASIVAVESLWDLRSRRLMVRLSVRLGRYGS